MKTTKTLKVSQQVFDGLVDTLSTEAKRHTRAVSAKDRDQRLTLAAITFATDLAIAINPDPTAALDLKAQLLDWITQRQGA